MMNVASLAAPVLSSLALADAGNDTDGLDAAITDGAKARRFLLAGNARVTLVSQKTGTRFTYRVKASADGRVHFVSVLTGSDNEGDFSFLGTVFPPRPVSGEAKPSAAGSAFVHGRKSRIGRDAKSAKAFAWAFAYLSRGELPPSCEIHHEGRCGRCGRALTVPESIESGLGPVCATKE